ncbi:mitochondrial thioredoxin [Coniothyrium glycines]
MSPPTEIQAPLHFRTLLTSSTYLIADFYATWCPPCKTIAPIYTSLSGTHSASGNFVFVKVNVDEQRELAGQYGVTAMPTFVLFKGGKKVAEVRGADVGGLKKLVEGASADLKSVMAEEKKKKAEGQQAATPVAEKQRTTEEKRDGEEKTVSGSYDPRLG